MGAHFGCPACPLVPLVSLFESPRGASCARLRHGQIKAKSKHNGAAYNPLLQQIKIYYPAGKRHTRGTEREGGKTAAAVGSK